MGVWRRWNSKRLFRCSIRWRWGTRRGDLLERLGMIREYSVRFERSFGDPRIDLDRLAIAIAAYERTLVSEGALYDEWRRGRREKWTPEHEYGRQLFHGKGNCASCHLGHNFTGDQTVEITPGLRLKVPSLREVGRTAPYLHDGSVATLEGVLERHGAGPALTQNERKAVLRFLESLSSEGRP